MKLEIKFSEGCKHVSFDPCGEKPEIFINGLGNRPITDNEILEKFAFFFKNVDFYFDYADYWSDSQEYTQFSMNCLKGFDRTELSRLTKFVDSLTSVDQKSLPVKFFFNKEGNYFAMQGWEIVGILGLSSHFIDRQNRDNFVYAKNQDEIKSMYARGLFTPVFEALL